MIEEYLEKLKSELTKAGADPALIQDAVYDAEEYLRSEMMEIPDSETGAAFEQLTESYGAPEEVAASYLEAELTTAKALRLPEHPQSESAIKRFFGVLTDPRTYGVLLYMVLSLATGIAYFTLAVTGLSLSLGMAILIIGLPIMLIFLGLIRGVSFIEGRLVEALLGVRMPRRPRIIAREGNMIERIKSWLIDRRTWTTLVYMLIQLPLSIAYFSALVTIISIFIAALAAPIIQIVFDTPIAYSGRYVYYLQPWAIPLVIVAAGLLLVCFMHIARGIGYLHGAYAKAMLVGNVETAESGRQG